jgi:homocysteine S-methyltransferase
MIVDGGFGLELTRRGFDVSGGLWSGEAVLSQPEIVVAIHRDFLAAGATIIETATYQLSHAALRKRGYDDAAIDTVFARGVALAREAIAAHRAQTGTTTALLVAASLGPFGATVGDGSEYLGTQHLAPDALAAFHAERARSVVRAKPDIVFFETIPTAAEALVVANVARDLGLGRVWISLSCADGAHTFGGDRVTDVARLLDRFDAVEAIGVNCTAPAFITPLVRELQAGSTKPIVVCPNVGQHWETRTGGLVGGGAPDALLRDVQEWCDLGVAHIGGCCGVDPAMIAAIARTVMRSAAVLRVAHHTAP